MHTTRTYRLAAYLIALLLIVPFITGCGSLDGIKATKPLTNRVMCPIGSEDEASFVSRWLIFGVEVEIDKRDAVKIAEKCREPADLDKRISDAVLKALQALLEASPKK